MYHVLAQLVPPIKETPYQLHPRAHNRSLPVAYNLMGKNLVTRMLYKDSYWIIYHLFSYHYSRFHLPNPLCFPPCIFIFHMTLWIVYKCIHVHHLRLINVNKALFWGTETPHHTLNQDTSLRAKKLPLLRTGCVELPARRHCKSRTVPGTFQDWTENSSISSGICLSVLTAPMWLG